MTANTKWAALTEPVTAATAAAVTTDADKQPTFQVRPRGRLTALASPRPNGPRGRAARRRPGAGQDEARTVHGCQHYQTKCRILAPCCRRWFTCRLCHDAASDHEVDRYAITTMCCMLCQTVQPVGAVCTACHTPVRGGRRRRTDASCRRVLPLTLPRRPPPTAPPLAADGTLLLRRVPPV